VQGRSEAVRRASPASRLKPARLALAARSLAATAAVWLVWLGAVLLTIAIGLAAGVYALKVGWAVHDGVWPLLTWDYDWYYSIACLGYPEGTATASTRSSRSGRS
jgi:hypothetical protein